MSTVYSVMVTVNDISITIFLYNNEGNSEIKCQIRKDGFSKYLPLVHELSEEEYFQQSLLIDVDIDLLKSIQEHAIEVIDTNGESVNFHDFQYSKELLVTYNY